MTQCDIILLSYESPDLLEKCVMSVLKHTDIKSNLIIVDNNSKDPAVRQFLEEIHGNETVTIEKVYSEENAGFARGMNKGIRLSGAPFICLLNNDCVVTDGWLSEMIGIASSKKEIGIVNPNSNTFGSVQQPGVSIDEHAALLSDKKGTYAELGHSIGFAELIKREVIDKIGYLDEVYEGVCYEDTDFSIRAQRAGYLSVIAEGAYVYHKEQASRRKLKNKEKIYAKNKDIFEKRWGKVLRIFYYDNKLDLFDDSEKVTQRYELLKGLARQRAFVDMGVSDRHYGESKDDAVEFIRTIRHTDIRVIPLDEASAGSFILWKVLTKKKKYNAVIINKGPVASILKALWVFHRARVFTIEGLSKCCRSGKRILSLHNCAEIAQLLRGVKNV